MEAADALEMRARLSAVERRSIATALARSNNNRATAAKLLGISRPLLYKKLRIYGIE